MFKEFTEVTFSQLLCDNSGLKITMIITIGFRLLNC